MIHFLSKWEISECMITFYQQKTLRPMKGNPWQSWTSDFMMWNPHSRYWIQDSTSLDSGFHDVEPGFQVLDSRLHVIGFRIPWCELCIPGTGFKIPPQWIPDFMMWTSDRSQVLDSRFHFSEFQIPKVLVLELRIPRLEFWIP